ncbi:DUF6838 family protein [Chengkuizengella sp. SCS-71B]|uniref:phage tail terminator family protein n=1 Tax=Chengkuizengella sp. SCS-71B TaxID=3115290 RepID=UPI0032C21DE0
MNINTVRDGVISKIKFVFPGVKVTGEKIRQGLKVPQFFVKILLSEQERELNRRYKRMHTFDIHYFATSNEDAHKVAEKLYSEMEYIEVSQGKIRGRKMRHEVFDNVLHFFVDYDFHVLREIESVPKMQRMEEDIQHG